MLIKIKKQLTLVTTCCVIATGLTVFDTTIVNAKECACLMKQLKEEPPIGKGSIVGTLTIEVISAVKIPEITSCLDYCNKLAKAHGSSPVVASKNPTATQDLLNVLEKFNAGIVVKQ